MEVLVWVFKEEDAIIGATKGTFAASTLVKMLTDHFCVEEESVKLSVGIENKLTFNINENGDEWEGILSSINTALY